MIIIGAIASALVAVGLVACSFYIGLKLGLQSVRIDGEVPKYSEPRILPPKKHKPVIGTPDISEIAKKQREAKMEIPTIVRRRDER